MTKEERTAYYRIYRAKNREKIAEIKKKSYLKNKEYYKKYYLENKEKLSEYAKDYYKQYRDDKKDGYHRVYLLEDYNYVGVTDNIYYRFNLHKSKFNRDCTNHRVLYKTKDRDEALELEALLHDMGYEGGAKNNKYA